jgi:hypothetical protein
VNTLAHSPKWLKTLLVVVYDEHGGYYDHVPPPAALAPDAIPPLVKPGQSRYDGFTRYGFRVPAMLIGPYAKRDHVSHIIYDHTSILALLERKWNLPAMTFRDANANDLTDFLDRPAMAAGRPTFPELPALEAPGEDAITLRCSRTGPGEIPPQATAPRASPQLRLRDLGIDRRRRCLLVELRCSSGTLEDLQVELLRGRRRVASRRIARLTTASRDAVLRTGNHAPAPGRYTVVVRQQGRTLARRVIHVR